MANRVIEYYEWDGIKVTRRVINITKKLFEKERKRLDRKYPNGAH